MKKDIFYSKLKHWLENNGISAIKEIAPVKPSEMLNIDKSRIKSCDGFMFNGNKLFHNLKVFIDVDDNVIGLSVGRPSSMMVIYLTGARDFLGMPYREIIKNQDDVLDLYC